MGKSLLPSQAPKNNAQIAGAVWSGEEGPGGTFTHIAHAAARVLTGYESKGPDVCVKTFMSHVSLCCWQGMKRNRRMFLSSWPLVYMGSFDEVETCLLVSRFWMSTSCWLRP